jgi:hypothetical protein
MTTMKTPGRSLAFACLCLAAAAHGAEYRNFYDALEPFARLKDLKYIVATAKVQPKDPAVKPESVSLTIRAKSGPIVVRPRADGSVDFPVTRALADENPAVEHALGEGRLSLTLSVDVRAEPVQRFDYRLLFDMKADWDEAVRRQNLLYRMLAPSARSAIVGFPKGSKATAEVRLPTGTRTYAADAEGAIHLPFDEAAKAANAPVVLSAMPERISLDFKR